MWRSFFIPFVYLLSLLFVFGYMANVTCVYSHCYICMSTTHVQALHAFNYTYHLCGHACVRQEYRHCYTHLHIIHIILTLVLYVSMLTHTYAHICTTHWYASIYKQISDITNRREIATLCGGAGMWCERWRP